VYLKAEFSQTFYTVDKLKVFNELERKIKIQVFTRRKSIARSSPAHRPLIARSSPAHRPLIARSSPDDRSMIDHSLPGQCLT
jgi:hypothetical protein